MAKKNDEHQSNGISDFMAHARDDDIKVKIDDALEALERAYPEQLRGLLPRIFASSEGKRGGEYFTPESIVKCLVKMIEPTEGVVMDSCCGSGGMRERKDEILFIDGRSLGMLIPGSRKQKALSEEKLERIAAVYREYRRTGVPAEQPGFAAEARRLQGAIERNLDAVSKS